MRRCVQQIVIEILGMPRIFLGLGIGLGNADKLQEAETMRIGVAAFLGRELPIAIGDVFGNNLSKPLRWCGGPNAQPHVASTKGGRTFSIAC